MVIQYNMTTGLRPCFAVVAEVMKAPDDSLSHDSTQFLMYELEGGELDSYDVLCWLAKSTFCCALYS